MTSIFLTNNVAKVEISPPLGGAILSYEAKLNNSFVSILRKTSNVKSVLDSNCFPLIPYSNRIKDGQFTWHEKEISLPLNHLPEKHSIHGHGWQLPWTITEQSEQSLTLEYHYSVTEWPYSYSAKQVFILNEKALSITLTMKNTDNCSIPAGLGLHPYFNLTRETLIQCEVDQMWAVDDECMPTRLVEKPLAMKRSAGFPVHGSNLDNVFTGFSGYATVTWPELSAKASISTSSNCKFLVIYSPKGENYFCFEPVTHCTDAINMADQGFKKTGITALKSNEVMTISMKISPDSLVK